MGDLKSKKLIVLKGFFFFLIILLSMALIIIESKKISVFILCLVLAWASARFYYFLFYVLHQYVDHELKYTGIVHLITVLFKNISKKNEKK
jgi:hypothetical protein